MHALVKCNLTHSLQQIHPPPLTCGIAWFFMNENLWSTHTRTTCIYPYSRHVQPLPSPYVCVFVFDPNGSTDEMVYFYVNIFKSSVLSVFNMRRIEVIWCAMAIALDMTHRWMGQWLDIICILRLDTQLWWYSGMDLGHCPCVRHALSKTKGDNVVV